MNLSFLGIFNFTAPYLPWVLLAFSVTLRSNAAVDLLGIVAGGLSTTWPVLCSYSRCERHPAIAERLSATAACHGMTV